MDVYHGTLCVVRDWNTSDEWDNTYSDGATIRVVERVEPVEVDTKWEHNELMLADGRWIDGSHRMAATPARRGSLRRKSVNRAGGQFWRRGGARGPGRSGAFRPATPSDRHRTVHGDGPTRWAGHANRQHAWRLGAVPGACPAVGKGAHRGC